MASDEINEKLHELTEALFGRSLRTATLLTKNGPPFDTTKSNVHDSKADFQAEIDAVRSVSKHAKAILDVFYSEEAKARPDHGDMVTRVQNAFQASSLREVNKRPIDSPSDLALKNVVQSGFFFNSVLVLLELYEAAYERQQELADQERDYWSVPHRPPNYYARTIALRFARLYAREKSERPTFGISSQGNHPSTDFGRALEQVFKILGIKASIKNAATWAIDQLTEDDWKPHQNALMGSLFGATKQPPGLDPEILNAVAHYNKLAEKGRE